MKEHTVIGDRLCGERRSLRRVRPILRSHHERTHGSGCPDGLRGDDPAELPGSDPRRPDIFEVQQAGRAAMALLSALSKHMR